MNDETRTLHKWETPSGSLFEVTRRGNTLGLKWEGEVRNPYDYASTLLGELARLAERVRELERLVPISELERIKP